jgi:hypothetical protein
MVPRSDVDSLVRLIRHGKELSGGFGHSVAAVEINTCVSLVKREVARTSPLPVIQDDLR